MLGLEAYKLHFPDSLANWLLLPVLPGGGVGGECLKITKLEKNISSVFHFLFSSVSDFKSTAVDKSFWWYGTVDTEELYNF